MSQSGDREWEANSAFALLGWRWSSVKRGLEGDSAGCCTGEQVWWDGTRHTREREPAFFGSSVCRTSHRMWVAFLALKSSGVSSSTVSPLPFTPSSRSLLYSLYRKNDKRQCREGAHRAGRAEARGTHGTVGERGGLLRRLKVTKAPAAVADSRHWRLPWRETVTGFTRRWWLWQWVLIRSKVNHMYSWRTWEQRDTRQISIPVGTTWTHNWNSCKSMQSCRLR